MKSRALAAGLGKSMQVADDGKSWNSSHWQLGYASLGKSRQIADDGKSWNSSHWQLG